MTHLDRITYCLTLIGLATVTTGLAQADAIDESFRDPVFDAYQQGPGVDVQPSITVSLDDETRFALPPSAYDQQVKMIQRLGHPSVDGDDQLIVGVQLEAEDFARQAATLLYREVDDRFQLETVLPMRERFNSFRLDYSQAIKSRLLILRGTSGMHFHEVWIYDFDTSPPTLLAGNGSAAGVHLREGQESDAPQRWVGVANWDDPDWNYATGERLWNVYTWQQDSCAYDPNLSTTEKRSLGTRMREFLEEIERW